MMNGETESYWRQTLVHLALNEIDISLLSHHKKRHVHRVYPVLRPLINFDLPTSASRQASTIQHVGIGAKSSLKATYHGAAANGDSKRSVLHFNP